MLFLKRFLKIAAILYFLYLLHGLVPYDPFRMLVLAIAYFVSLGFFFYLLSLILKPVSDMFND